MTKSMPRRNRKRLQAFLVLGDQNAGKSTLIRHLSGVYRDTVVRLVTTSGEDIDVRAITSSVNEQDDPPTPDEWADELVEAAENELRGYPYVLLPLRYVSKGNNPAAQLYYKALARVADIQVLAFREDQPKWVRHPAFSIADQERNKRARNARRHLGWV